MHCIAALDARAGRPLSVFENRRLEECTFVYPWTAVVEYNADYRTERQAEMLRHGSDHTHCRSQYALQASPTAGRLCSNTYLAQMANSGDRPARPALVLAGAGVLDDDGLSSGRTGGLGARPQIQSPRFSPSFALTTRSFLGGPIGANLAHSFSFTAVSKSAWGHQLLAAPRSGRPAVEAAQHWRPRLAIGRRTRR